MNRLSRNRMWNRSLMLIPAIAVLGGCQQTSIEIDEPDAVVEVAAAPVSESASAPAVTPASSPASVARVTPPVVENAPVQSGPALQPASSATMQPARGPVEPPEVDRAPSPPVFVTVPIGTILPVELEKTLSSHTSQVGEQFRARLTQDIAVDGRMALPRGSMVLGKVTEAKPAKKVGGRARLSLEFYQLVLPDGRQVPLGVEIAEAGKSQNAKDAAIIGGSTLGGAVIGSAVDKGEGTAVGAIVGGLAGAAIANETRAKPVVLNSGTLLTLETVDPISVEIDD